MKQIAPQGGSRTAPTFLLLVILILLFCPACLGPKKVAGPPSVMPHDRYLTVDGLAYHYLEYPADGEIVFLQHGFACSTYTWQDVARLLQKQGFHVYALDMKGFGYSDKPKNSDYDAVSLMEGVNAWMDALGLSQVNYVGNSLGGGVGMLLAQHHPDKVKRLVLIDSAVPWDFNMPFVIKLAELPGAPVLSSLIMSKGLVRSNLRQVYFDDSKIKPGTVDAYYKRLRTKNAAHAQALVARAIDMSLFGPAVEALASMETPVLILWGGEDQWVSVDLAYKLKQTVPRATLVVLPQCGHMPQEEKPKETAALITDFITGLPIEATPLPATCP